MKRVLVFGMTENPGGIESVLINYYRNIDRSKLQFDFLCNTLNKVAYEDEILSLGANVFHIEPRRKNRKRFKKELDNLFQEHENEWESIWVNMCNLVNIDYLIFAKKHNIQKRIIHSHNSQNMEDPIRGILHSINKRRIQKYATDYWACSESAADWFYEAEIRRKVRIIHNAIDVDKMSFDGEKRKVIREANAFEDSYIIGNVGRLHFQKNQSFMIDVFKEYHSQYPDSILVLVGQGEDERILKERVVKEGLAESVRFMGVQKDIQGWLSSFDLFLFPSLFEGLGVALLEAQANGVPILASANVIPTEVRINDNFTFMSLEKTAGEWAKTIQDKRKKARRCILEDIKEGFITKGYDISTEADTLTHLLIQEG